MVDLLAKADVHVIVHLGVHLVAYQEARYHDVVNAMRLPPSGLPGGRLRIAIHRVHDDQAVLSYEVAEASATWGLPIARDVANPVRSHWAKPGVEVARDDDPLPKRHIIDGSGEVVVKGVNLRFHGHLRGRVHVDPTQPMLTAMHLQVDCGHYHTC